MRIDIPDEIDGKTRRKILYDNPLDYAYKKFNGNRKQISRWLGISPRTLTDRLSKKGLTKKPWMVRKIKELVEQGVDIKDSKMWRYSSERLKREINKIMEELSKE